MRDAGYGDGPARDRLVHVVGPTGSLGKALDASLRGSGFRTAVFEEPATFLSTFLCQRPDAVIVNLRGRNGEGLSMLRRIKAARPGTAVIALADEPRVEVVVVAMRAGASDVLAAPIDPQRLLHALLEVLPPAAPAAPRADQPLGASDLTRRERDVLALIADGRSNKEAGQALGISPRTVEQHRARVMAKLGARNTADLVRIVLSA